VSSATVTADTAGRGWMLAWAGIAFGAVYLIYIGGGWWGIYSPYLRIATMLLAATTLGAWAVVASRDPAWRPRSVMWPSIVAVLGAMAISTVFSRVPRVSLEYLGYTVVLVPLYLLLVRLFGDEFFRRRLVVLVSMLFGVTAALYIATVIGGWIEWWQFVGGFTVPPLRPGFGGLTYNNPSAALTMVALLAVVPAAAFGSASRRGVVVLTVVVLAIGIVALMSGSRSGWFALALTAVLAPAVWLSSPNNRTELRTRAGDARRRPAVRLAAVIAVVALLASAVVLTPSVLRRAFEGGEDLRLAYATAAFRMFEESPLVGTGPGTWVIQRPAYTLASEPDYYIPHAHDLEVQTLAELGLVGAIGGAILIVNLAWLLRHGATGDDARRRWWAWAAGIGLLYFGLHQVLDFYANMPAFLLASVIPVAYLDAALVSEQRARTTSVPAPRPLVDALAAVVVVVAIAGLLVQEVPALRHDQALRAAAAGDWAGADSPARDAAAMDPDIGSYQLTAGLTAAHAGDRLSAIGFFERVVGQADLPEAWLDLAAEQAEAGMADESHASVERALRLGGQPNAISMAAGDLALRLGDRRLAIDLFVRSLLRTPSLAGDPWWAADGPQLEIYQDVLSRATQQAPEIAWRLWLMAGETDKARMAAGDSGFSVLVVDAWTGNAAALDGLLAICAAGPLEVGNLGWCARVLRHLGREPTSEVFRERVELISIGASPLAAELRVSSPGVMLEQLAGDPADLWATYTYRRPAPWDLLAPSLIHLRLE